MTAPTTSEPGLWKWAAVAVVIAAAIGAVWWLRDVHSEASAPGERAESRSGSRATGSTTAAAEQPLAAASAPQAAEPGIPAVRGPERITPEARIALLAAIATALQTRTEAAPAVGAPPSQPQGTLEADYLRERIGEIIPLVRECYHLALENSPDVEGSLNVRFTVVADENLGGVIEKSEIVGGTAQANPDLSECVQETMYALRLKAPKGGGRTTVTYPFRFAKAGQ